MLLKLFHITLSLLLFVSSTGVVVNEHYCQDKLKSMALFVKAEACHVEKAGKACTMHASSSRDHHPSFKKKNCCDDRTEYFKSNDNQLTQSFELGLLKNINLIAAPIAAFYNPLPLLEAHFPTYNHYKPPIVCDDWQPMLQVFRL